MVWALSEAERFVRRLRSGHPFRGRPFPYVVVPEMHKDGHVHLHALLGEFVPDRMLSEAWGHGWVDARRLTASNRPGRNGGRSAARAAASYASKYVGKCFDEYGDWPRGRQRYRVAEGFQPVSRSLAHRGTRHSALADLIDGHGLHFERAVWSEDVEHEVPWVWVQVREVRAPSSGPGT